MGYKRQLPVTDDARQAALSNAKQRKDSVPPEENVFSQKISNALDAEEPKFIALRVALSVAEGKDHNAVANFTAVLQKLKNLSSHGLQILNFKVIDEAEGFTKAERILYGMDLGGHLPPLGTETEIIQAANDFIRGEDLRIAKGGVPLVDVSKASVVAMLENVQQERLTRSAASIVLGKALHNLTDERKIVDKLIRQMWGDIEYAVRNLRVGARHEFGINWGMHFVHTPDPATLNILVEDAESRLPLAGVKLRIGNPKRKAGAKAITNSHGSQIMRSKNFNATSIIAELPLYDTVVREICLKEGETMTIVLKMKKSAQ